MGLVFLVKGWNYTTRGVGFVSYGWATGVSGQPISLLCCVHGMVGKGSRASRRLSQVSTRAFPMVNLLKSPKQRLVLVTRAMDGSMQVL